MIVVTVVSLNRKERDKESEPVLNDICASKISGKYKNVFIGQIIFAMATVPT